LNITVKLSVFYSYGNILGVIEQSRGDDLRKPHGIIDSYFRYYIVPVSNMLQENPYCTYVDYLKRRQS